jgi:peptide/nickel transport system substrate-binding protein
MTWENAEELIQSDIGLEYSRYLPGVTNNIFMRMDQPEKPWADKKVRHALAMAIDNQAIADGYYGGNAEIFCYPAPRAVEYSCMYTPLDELPESIQMLYEYHPDRARELLDEAGYGEGFSVSMLTYAGYVDQLSIIQDYWADIGVTMNIDVKDYGVFVSQCYQHKHEEMLMIYMDNSSCVAQPSIRPGATMNMGMIDDPYINENLLAVLDENTLNWSGICEVAKREFPYVMEQAYSIEFPTPYSYLMWWPWVKGYDGESCVGFWNSPSWLQYVWLDQELKAEMGY